MKFLYQYKTSDGVRHEETCFASSERRVYDELKQKGIRPFNVRLAPGIFNRILSFGKRGLAILVLTILALVLVFALRSTQKDIELIEEAQATPLARHHIYCDPALMDEMKRTQFAAVFPDPGERLLACYAQPGVIVSSPFLSPLQRPALPDFSATLAHELVILPNDSREVRELKRIVLWMKNELREYLSDGVGTPETYLKRLNQRQHEELLVLQRARNQVSVNNTPEELQKANAALRAIGLETLVPDVDQEK